MTEADWLACAAPERMLEWLGPRLSPRQLRLFACACCRQVWDLLVSRRSLEAVLAAERYADGLPGGERLPMAQRDAWRAAQALRDEPARHLAARAVHQASLLASERPVLTRVLEAARLSAEAAVRGANSLGAWARARSAQCALLRDLVGNPFRPARVERAWCDDTVLRLARTLRDEGHFEEVPVLGDALEEAGCTEADVLAHCRGPGPHVRGCWLVDQVLAGVAPAVEASG
jgi:hypothetical protein